jgi:precorrin-2 dehydrogenase/sirohydrochlorin ferrochelatase
MPLFPAFLKLAGRRCLVVGAGRIAEDKIRSLLLAGGNVHVVAPKATPRVRAWARAKNINLDLRSFRSDDLAGAFLVIAATSFAPLHKKIYSLARHRGILCNAVDDPDHCDFYYGAVLRRGELQIAISTGGYSPALAQRLRKQLARDFGPEYQAWLREIGKLRKQLFANKNLSAVRRKALLHRLASDTSFKEFQRRRKKRPKLGGKSH